MSFALSNPARTDVLQNFESGISMHYVMLDRARDVWMRRREASPRNALQSLGRLKRQSIGARWQLRVREKLHARALERNKLCGVLQCL